MIGRIKNRGNETEKTMRTKTIVVASAILAIAAIGTWAGRSVWARQHGLVTLNVRNAPLKEVIQKLEKQTGQKIALDRKLDGLVTLDMTRKPLASVLDRIAGQCSASWRTVHAVYESRSALPELESVLYGDRKLDEAGWKMIAPGALNGIPIDLPGGKSVVVTNVGQAGSMPVGGERGGPVRVMVRRGGDGSAPQVVTETGQLPPGAAMATEDAVVVGGTNGSVKMRKQGSPAVVRVMRKKGDGPGGAVEEEIWTPVEVVLESRLSDRLSDFSGAPTLEAAQQAANSVKGTVKTYYALRKSPFGMGMGMGGLPGMSFNVGSQGRGGMIKSSDLKGQGIGSGTNAMKMVHAMPSTGDLEAAVAQRRADELGKLTPEQRVLRARERQQSGQKL
jgi:hypothetical protein